MKNKEFVRVLQGICVDHMNGLAHFGLSDVYDAESRMLAVRDVLWAVNAKDELTFTDKVIDAIDDMYNAKYNPLWDTGE